MQLSSFSYCLLPSHGRDLRYSYEGITLAVDSLRGMALILSVPEWMTQCEEAHNLNCLQDKVLLFITPTCSDLIEASEISFMDALAKKTDALIVTQTGPDTWSEPCNRRILQFTMTSDSFMLPRDPRGKKGPTLQEMCLSNSAVPNEQKVKGKISQLKNTFERYYRILEGPQNSSSVQKDPQLVIIDGSNVAMAHGLHTFYSVRGIELAVKYFKNEGHRVNVYVPIWRKNSKNTVFEHNLLQQLYQDGLVTYTPSMAYDDLLMLEEAKNKHGFIVSNDLFRDVPPEYKDTIQRRIPFRFEGNRFRVLPNPCQALDYSGTDPPVVYGHEAWPIHTHSTKAVDNDDTDATIVYDKTTWSMATPSTEIHQHPEIPPASGKVYSHGKAIVQDERLTLAKAKPKQELQPAPSGDSRAEHQTSSQDCGELKKPTSTCRTTSSLQQAQGVWQQQNQQCWKQRTNKLTSTHSNPAKEELTTSETTKQQAHLNRPMDLLTAEQTTLETADQQAHFNTCTWSGNSATNSGTNNVENSIPTSSPQQAQEVRQQQNQRRKGRTNKLNSTCSRPPSAVETTMKTVDQQTHLNIPKSRINSGTNNDGNSGSTSSPQHAQGVRQQRNQQWWNRQSRKQRTNKVTSTGSGGLPTAETSETADPQAHLKALIGSVNSKTNIGNGGLKSLLVRLLFKIFYFIFYKL
ncbi:uncharacterized protein LOC143121244 [Alosa pseudoharengus]|uniref:uncharacterized protein LOC143121244 n=1 Tax=Alosa pseudoharengus TaxID=34774 RepID=UPI003F8AEE80